jgi:hypothetical protein
MLTVHAVRRRAGVANLHQGRGLLRPDHVELAEPILLHRPDPGGADEPTLAHRSNRLLTPGRILDAEDLLGHHPLGLACDQARSIFSRTSGVLSIARTSR